MSSDFPNPDGRDSAADSSRPIGMLLREARLSRGMSLSDVGQRLHLQSNIIEAIEREDFERLGATVYARGYLQSYARLVQIDLAKVDATLNAYHPPEPPLRSATYTPRWRHLYDRYGKRAMYVALTGVIVFPIVLLGLRERLPLNPPRLLSLDNYVVEGADSGTPQAAVPAEEQPVTASLAPFFRESAVAVSEPPVDVAGQSADALPQTTAIGNNAGTELTLAFRGSSWVEVVSQDGKRLAYGLIAAGEHLSFPSATVARVSIGDADAVDVSLKGRNLDTDPFRHAKVARFTLSSSGEVTAGGG